MRKFMLKAGRIISCIVLATIMVVSGILPSVGTVALANETDDLTGWTVGANNTITGNPKDGWDLTLTDCDYLSNASKFATYQFDGHASDLQVKMNLSAMASGQSFILQIGNAPANVYSWATIWTDGTGISLYVKRSGDNQLTIYGHRGNKETTKAVVENVDFTVSHVFEFLQDDSGKYYLAVDGTLCLTSFDDNPNQTVDGYVTNGGTGDSVFVTFIQNTNNLTIGDINFAKKPDLTGWTVGANNTITGNPTDGWDLTLTDCSNVSSVAKFATYKFDGHASDLQVMMNLSAMASGQGFILQIGNAPANIYSWATGWNGGTGVALYVTRTGDNQLTIYGHRGNKETTKAVVANVDFTVSHVFEFLQDEGGKYYLAVDGTLCLTSFDDNPNQTVDGYVTNGGTGDSVFVTFIQNTNNLTINNIQFSKKAALVAQPELKESITMHYTVNLGFGITGTPVMKYMYNGEEIIVDGTSVGDNAYTFALEGILPQDMGKTIDAYVSIDGTEITRYEGYSVRQYCLNQLEKTDDANLKALLVALLNYGTQAQGYFGSTDTAINDGLDQSLLTNYLAGKGYDASNPKGNVETPVAGTNAGDYVWKAATLGLYDTIKIRVKFQATSVDGLKVIVNGTDEYTEFVSAGTDLWYVYIPVYAADFADSLVITFQNGTETVGATLTYSVNTYVKYAMDNGSAEVKPLVEAIYYYGVLASERA